MQTKDSPRRFTNGQSDNFKLFSNSGQLYFVRFKNETRIIRRSSLSVPPDPPGIDFLAYRQWHFGRELPTFTWEKTDKAKVLRQEAGM